MAAPALADAAAMATTSVASSLRVAYSNGSTQTYKLGYEPMFITGGQVPNLLGGTVLVGGYVDINGNLIIDKSASGQERPFYSDCPDGMSLLQTVAGADKARLGVKGHVAFAVVQFECTTRDQAQASLYGRLPSPTRSPTPTISSSRKSGAPCSSVKTVACTSTIFCGPTTSTPGNTAAFCRARLEPSPPVCRVWTTSTAGPTS
jgi:hypothetical protein